VGALENAKSIPLVSGMAVGNTRILSPGVPRRNAGKPISQVPDLSGIWLGKPIQSLSPSDPTAQKPGAEGDIPYTPWAIARMKAERPATGRNQTFANTTDPALKYADPDGYPRASIHPMRFKIVPNSRLHLSTLGIQQILAANCAQPATFGGSGHLVVWGIRWQVGGGHTGGGIRWVSKIPRGSIPSATCIPKISTS